MYWREVLSPSELEEFVEFEQQVFPAADWLTLEEYNRFIEERNLRIFLLTVDKGMQQRRYPNIVGSFNCFIDNDIAYMGGFSIGLEQRGFRLSYRIIDKLIEEYGNYEIVCKTHPKDRIMQRVLTRGGFTNKLDKFENGTVWSYWSRKS